MPTANGTHPANRSFIVLLRCAAVIAAILPILYCDFARAADVALTRYSFSEYHMGGDAKITVYAFDEQAARAACSAAYKRIAELDTIMSDYRKDSELNRLSDRAGGLPVRVSADLYTVLSKAQEISRLSQGAFDVTVGPLIALWRPARRSGLLPDKQLVEEARGKVGWRNIVLNPRDRSVRLLKRGMRLDLGGIAKGYACDQAQNELKKRGITSALVEMGGDMVVSGPPPGTEGWTIRVPNAGDDRGPKDLNFKHCAISTSGDTEQFVVIGGIQYSHVVDPRTGWALTNRVQATVVAKHGLDTDPLATALTVASTTERGRMVGKLGKATVYIRALEGVSR